MIKNFYDRMFDRIMVKDGKTYKKCLCGEWVHTKNKYCGNCDNKITLSEFDHEIIELKLMEIEQSK